MREIAWFSPMDPACTDVTRFSSMNVLMRWNLQPHLKLEKHSAREMYSPSSQKYVFLVTVNMENIWEDANKEGTAR